MTTCNSCDEPKVPLDMLFVDITKNFNESIKGNVTVTPAPPDGGSGSPDPSDGVPHEEDIEGSKGFGYVMCPQMYNAWLPAMSESIENFNALASIRELSQGTTKVEGNTWIIENNVLPPYAETEDGHDWHIGTIWTAIRIPKLKPGVMSSGDAIKFRTGELWSIGGQVEWLSDNYEGFTYGDMRQFVDDSGGGASNIVEDEHHYYIGSPTYIFWSPTYGFHLVEITYWNVIYRGKEYIFGVTLRDDVPINGEA